MKAFFITEKVWPGHEDGVTTVVLATAGVFNFMAVLSMAAGLIG